MRVIFETVPTPMNLTDPRTGKTFKGLGNLRVLMFETGEEPERIPNTTRRVGGGRPISVLRAEAGAGNPLVAVPTPAFSGWLQPTVIPERVLAQLPDTTRLVYRWSFVPGGEQ